MLAAVVTLLTGAWGVTRSPLMAVQRIAVEGAGHTTRASVIAAAGLGRHRQMVDLNPSTLRSRLDALPWVAKATVRRTWPSTVAIRIRERQPAAQLTGPGGQPAVVDASGRVLIAGPEAASLLASVAPPLPRLHGAPIAGPAGTVVGSASAAGLKVAVAVAEQLRRGLIASGSSTGGSSVSGSSVSGPSVSLRSVALAPDGTVSAQLSSGSSVRFGAVDQLAAKLLAMATVFQRVVMTEPVIVDVRVPDSPVLIPASMGSIVSTVPRG